MNDPIVHAFCPVSLLLNIECDIGLIQGPGVRRGHGRILICGVRKEHRRILICGIRRGHGQILICCHHIHTNLHRGGHHAFVMPVCIPVIKGVIFIMPVCCIPAIAGVIMGGIMPVCIPAIAGVIMGASCWSALCSSCSRD